MGREHKGWQVRRIAKALRPIPKQLPAIAAVRAAIFASLSMRC